MTTAPPNSTLWEYLPRPIVGLAPMNGITDHPFRHIQKKYGGPAPIYTEFTGVERLEIGDADLLDDFRYDEGQRPIVAQIFGRTPDLFRRMAVLLCQLGFDGIDVNMGCPSPSVVHRGSGAGLIRTPGLARAIVAATKAGVQEWRNGATVRDDPGVPRPIVAEVEARHARLPAHAQARRAVPVSVKTRIGYDKPEVDEWVPRLLECEPAALAVHGRTLRQGYAGAADWDAIGRVGELARGVAPVLGNGDVSSLDAAQWRSAVYGLDGVLIGRASYGNPFVFRQTASAGAPGDDDRLRLLYVALEHARLYEECFGRRGRYHFLPMRKHLAWYVRGLPSASHARRELVQASSAAEAEAILHRYLARARISLS